MGRLYNVWSGAKRVEKISHFIDAGGVAAAILTKQRKYLCWYVSASIRHIHLNVCRKKRRANMITNGESRIDKVVAVY